MIIKKTQWVFEPKADIVMFVVPIIIASSVAVFAYLFGLDLAHERTLLIQIILYIIFDYAHTYAILFRTYFDSQTRKDFLSYLIIIPIGVFFVGVVLYYKSAMYFWTFFGYLQVFHFVRQQYGWIKISEKNEDYNIVDSHLNTWVIYACTLYPIIYWHTYLIDQFYWYKNMIAFRLPPEIERVAWVLFVIINILFLLRNLWWILIRKTFPAGRLIIYFMTFTIWYIGLVVLKISIVSFAAFNTIGHGWPYIVLIYRYMKLNWVPQTKISHKILANHGFFIYYAILVFFAYVETYLQYSYQEKNYDLFFFGEFKALSANTMMWLVPLLMVPQATHSVLDGFIWRFRSPRNKNLITRLRKMNALSKHI